MSKLTLETMKRIALSRSGECLSLTYANNKIKLRWKCSVGHTWEARADMVKRGNWCPYCSKKIKYTLEYCREIAKKRGGDCISKEYINSQNLMKWICAKGHTWENTFSGILNSRQWCPHCYGNVRHTIEEMRELAARFEGECLSMEYKGNKTKLQWKCQQGHVFEAVPNSIVTGHWCKVCGMRRAGMKNRFTFDELKRMAKERGGEFLSKAYRDGKMKLGWRCADGHEFKMTSVMVNSGQWCPECSTGKSERVCRQYFEAIFGKKFPKVKPSWLIGPKGHKLELDGYNEELKLAFEYQGAQHYFQNNRFHKNRTLESQKGYDNIKRDLCKKNGITLIEIPFTVKYNWLQAFILKRCEVNNIVVPNQKVNINSNEISSPKRLQTIKKIAESKGGTCLSDKYIDNNTKLRFGCQDGHEWETIPQVIIRGNWCRICSGNAKSNINEMQKLAASKNGKCLSLEYVNTITKLEWRCKEGHVWKATPISVKRGSWCPLCSRKLAAEKLRLSIDEFREISKKNGGECLSPEYTNNKTKLLWRCKLDHKWWQKPEHIKKGHWCPKCAKIQQKL